MDSRQTDSDKWPLLDFCKEVISRHADKWPPDEDTIAREFVDRHPFESLPSLQRIGQFSGALGIETSTASLPERVQGFNFVFAERKLILLPENETLPGSREHTFFHELREILEYIFRDLGFATVEVSELEEHSEDFAAQVRIAGSLKLCLFFLERAENIQARWKRWLCYAGIMCGTLSYGLNCLLLPYAEDRFSRHS